jgi:repressor LexA
MLTKKQKEVLDFVKKYTDKHGYAPSLDEVRKHFGLASASTAHYYLSKLEEEGYIKREANQPRGTALQAFDFSMSLSGGISGFEFISIPLVGAANCGPAELLAEENIEAYIRVDKKTLPRKSGIFALRASGNSMNRAKIKGKNIEDGDIVLIDSEDRVAQNGDYVLSIIDGKANLKKLKVEKGQVMLVSESTENFKPILIISGDDWLINGKIITVIKKPKK